MKHAWSGAVAVFACALTMSLSAQSAPPAGGQQPTTPPQAPTTSSAGMQRSADAQNTVTLTGCLERATASAAAPTGTTGAAAGASSAAAKFVLNNVTASPSAGAAGTAGTTGAARATASSYSLDGEDSKLSPHVGHKVEITGMVDSRSATGAEKAGEASASAPKLKVTAVKMIASSCTPQ